MDADHILPQWVLAIVALIGVLLVLEDLRPTQGVRWHFLSAQWQSSPCSGWGQLTRLLQPFCSPRSSPSTRGAQAIRTETQNHRESLPRVRDSPCGPSCPLRHLSGAQIWIQCFPPHHPSYPVTGEGNDNPLQCSCLENPMDKGS